MSKYSVDQVLRIKQALKDIAKLRTELPFLENYFEEAEDSLTYCLKFVAELVEKQGES